MPTEAALCPKRVKCPVRNSVETRDFLQRLLQTLDLLRSQCPTFPWPALVLSFLFRAVISLLLPSFRFSHWKTCLARHKKVPGPYKKSGCSHWHYYRTMYMFIIKYLWIELNYLILSFTLHMLFNLSPNLSTGLFILLKSFALAIWQDYMVLACVVLVKISFIIPFNSVNFRMKGDGKNSHRFVIAGSWPSTPAPASPLVLNPKRFVILPKLVQRQRVPCTSILHYLYLSSPKLNLCKVFYSRLSLMKFRLFVDLKFFCSIS